MNERNPLEVFFAGLFHVVKNVVVVFAWIIVIACVMTKNR